MARKETAWGNGSMATPDPRGVMVCTYEYDSQNRLTREGGPLVLAPAAATGRKAQRGWKKRRGKR